MLRIESIFTLASAPIGSAESARDEATRQGWSLLAMISILGVIVVCTMIMIIVLRRTRQARQIESRSPSIDPRDPWEESAKRMNDAVVEFDESDDNSDEDSDSEFEEY